MEFKLQEKIINGNLLYLVIFTGAVLAGFGGVLIFVGPVSIFWWVSLVSDPKPKDIAKYIALFEGVYFVGVLFSGVGLTLALVAIALVFRKEIEKTDPKPSNDAASP